MSIRTALRPRNSLRRWCAFNFVGFLGVGIQLAGLAILRGCIGLHYIIATALAVEGAVLHNFNWHERWTWADRTDANPKGMLGRMVRFNLTTGLLSIVSNLVFMALFVDGFGLHYLSANLLSITLCSIFNFLVSDRFIFMTRRH